MAGPQGHRCLTSLGRVATAALPFSFLTGGNRMTVTEIVGVVAQAKAKVDALQLKVLTYVPQILEAHQKALDADKRGYSQSLEAAIACGELLNAAKKDIKGKLNFTEWRAEQLGDRLPHRTATLYMKLANNKDQLRKPDLTTDDGK